MQQCYSFKMQIFLFLLHTLNPLAIPRKKNSSILILILWNLFYEGQGEMLSSLSSM